MKITVQAELPPLQIITYGASIIFADLFHASSRRESDGSLSLSLASLARSCDATQPDLYDRSIDRPRTFEAEYYFVLSYYHARQGSNKMKKVKATDASTFEYRRLLSTFDSDRFTPCKHIIVHP